MGEVSQQDARVSIVLKAIPHYRKRFLELLRDRLDAENIRLQVIYGQLAGPDVEKQHTVELSWGIKVDNRVFRLGGRLLYWQPCLPLVRDSRMVIVIQESKLLVNYLLFLRQLVGLQKMALWGHGRNFQPERRLAWAEGVKRWMSRRVHWWFAYTDRSKQVVTALGFPCDRVTVVDNALDTNSLIAAKRRFTEYELEKLREHLNLQSNDICIFVGSLTRHRRLEFLVAAADHIRKRLPSFELIVLGAGPEEAFIREAAKSRPWIKYIGSRFGSDRVPYFMLSKLMLIPGMVGLHVLDSFALEVPLVTVDLSYHSPEIEYLVDGINGRILPTQTTYEDYAEEIVRLITQPADLDQLRAGCRAARDRYTVERMVENFTQGILAALQAE